MKIKPLLILRSIEVFLLDQNTWGVYRLCCFEQWIMEKNRIWLARYENSMTQQRSNEKMIVNGVLFVIIR